MIQSQALQQIQRVYNNEVIQQSPKLTKKDTLQHQMDLTTPQTETPKDLNFKESNPIINWKSENKQDSKQNEELLSREQHWRDLSQKENEQFSQNKTLPNPLELHPTINFKMRQLTISWIIEQMVQLKNEENAIFLAISIFDEFCRKIRLNSNQVIPSYQMYNNIAAVCIWVASKFQDLNRNQIEISEIITMLKESVSPKYLLQTELIVLTCLKFQLLGIISPLQ